MIFNREEAIKNSRPVEELVEEYIDSLDRSENTIKSYAGILRRYAFFLKERCISKPKEPDIKKYKTFLKNDPTTERHSATIQKTIVCLRGFYKWCDRRGYYPDITTEIEGESVAATFKREPLKVEEAKKLLVFAKNRSTKSIICLRDYAILYLIITTGLRTVEIHRANVEDMVELGGQSYLYVQGKGRDDKDERVKLSPTVVDIINEYIEKRGIEDKALFLNHGHNNHSRRIDPKTVSTSIKHLLRCIGFDDKRYTAHSLRHTCATIALRNGADIQAVQHVLRHKSINTTTIYSHSIERSTNNVELVVDGLVDINEK